MGRELLVLSSWMIWVVEVGDEFLVLPRYSPSQRDPLTAQWRSGARIAIRSHDQAQKLYDWFIRRSRAFPSGSETTNEDWPHGSFFSR